MMENATMREREEKKLCTPSLLYAMTEKTKKLYTFGTPKKKIVKEDKKKYKQRKKETENRTVQQNGM